MKGRWGPNESLGEQGNYGGERHQGGSVRWRKREGIGSRGETAKELPSLAWAKCGFDPLDGCKKKAPLRARWGNMLRCEVHRTRGGSNGMERRDTVSASTRQRRGMGEVIGRKKYRKERKKENMWPWWEEGASEEHQRIRQREAKEEGKKCCCEKWKKRHEKWGKQRRLGRRRGGAGLVKGLAGRSRQGRERRRGRSGMGLGWAGRAKRESACARRARGSGAARGEPRTPFARPGWRWEMGGTWNREGEGGVEAQRRRWRLGSAVLKSKRLREGRGTRASESDAMGPDKVSPSPRPKSHPAGKGREQFDGRKAGEEGL